MSTEIEHKYLVKDLTFCNMVSKKHEISQGYLSREKGRTVRIRTCDDCGYITIKGAVENLVRLEFEYAIPIEDAKQLLKLCHLPIIKKTRSIVMHEGNRWEVDTFHGALEGLVMAELEVPTADYKFNLPPFIGREVTNDRRFYNSCLTSFAALKDALHSE